MSVVKEPFVVEWYSLHMPINATAGHRFGVIWYI